MRAWLLIGLAACTPAEDPPTPLDAQPLDATLDAAARDAQPDDATLDQRPNDLAIAMDLQVVDAAPDVALDRALPDDAAFDSAIDATVDAVIDAAPDMPPRPPRPAAPGEVLITELMVDPVAVGDDEGEWIELVNLTGDPLIVDGLVLTDGRDERTVVNGLRPLPAAGYGVLARNANPGLNGGVAPIGTYDAFVLGNGADVVEVQLPDGAPLDRIEYDATFPSPEGASIQFDADVAFADADGSGPQWCASRDVFGAGDRGSPGAANLQCRAAFTAEEFQALLVVDCPGCHTANGRLGGLNLDDHTRSIGRPSIDVPEIALIEPGDRLRSYLYLKLIDEQASVGGEGEIMPPMNVLGEVEIERIGRYIDGLPR